jgi:hypothetical protein
VDVKCLRTRSGSGNGSGSGSGSAGGRVRCGVKLPHPSLLVFERLVGLASANHAHAKSHALLMH